VVIDPFLRDKIKYNNFLLCPGLTDNLELWIHQYGCSNKKASLV